MLGVGNVSPVERIQQKFMTPLSLCQSLSGLSLAGGLFALCNKLMCRGARHFPFRCQAFFPATHPITPCSSDMSSCISTDFSSFILPKRWPVQLWHLGRRAEASYVGSISSETSVIPHASYSLYHFCLLLRLQRQLNIAIKTAEALHFSLFFKGQHYTPH